MATLIEIVAYDPSWPQHYQDVERRLRRLLGGRVLAVDHIGSTSIPGMPAKPVIDVDVTLRALADVPAASASLVDAGYQARGNRYDDDVRAFMWHGSEPRQRVYLCPPGNETHRRRLIFRDSLRVDGAVAAAYISLKARLAKQFPYDGDRYTAEKSNFINEIVDRAGL